MSRKDTVLKHFDKYKNFMDTVVEMGIEKNERATHIRKTLTLTVTRSAGLK